MNTMAPFYSGTDNRDDVGAVRFSGVVGHIKPDSYSTVWRFNYQDKKFDCTFDDIFALPVRPEPQIPEDWIGKIVTVNPGYSTGGFSQQGKGQGSSGERGRADHLLEWRFQKGHGGNGGNRVGPHLRDDRRSLPEHKQEIPLGVNSKYDDEDFSFQGYESALIGSEGWNDLVGGGEDDRLASAERALVVLREDPDYEESHLGNAQSAAWERAVRELDISANNGNAAQNYDPRFDPDHSDMYNGDDRYDEICATHGKQVAEAFCLMDDGMAELNGKDELVSDLMTDMIHMMSEEGQAKLFNALFHELPESAQQDLQMNGLH